MRSERVFLKENESVPYLDLYIHDRKQERPFVLVLPGGGYFFCNPRESDDIALAYASEGFDTAVLFYSTKEGVDHYPKQLMETAKAVDYIRHTLGYSKVYLSGFSAGGHLAASLGCLWNKEKALEDLDCRPDGCILAYPVLISRRYENKRTLDNISGGDPDLRAWVSLEERIDAGTPPFFIWHTYEDELVPVENSLIFASALRNNKIPFELHVFQKGPHALSLATEVTAARKEDVNRHASTWFSLATDWIRQEYVNNCL